MPDTRRRTLGGQQGHSLVRTAGGKNVGGSTETGLARLASLTRNATAGAVASVSSDAVGGKLTVSFSGGYVSVGGSDPDTLSDTYTLPAPGEWLVVVSGRVAGTTTINDALSRLDLTVGRTGGGSLTNSRTGVCSVNASTGFEFTDFVTATDATLTRTVYASLAAWGDAYLSGSLQWGVEARRLP